MASPSGQRYGAGDGPSEPETQLKQPKLEPNPTEVPVRMNSKYLSQIVEGIEEMSKVSR